VRSEEAIRSFIAIPLEAQAVTDLSRLSQALADEVAGDIRWVRPIHYHLTLKFLGELELPMVEEVKQALGDVAGRWAGGFALELRGLGAFPSPGRARVLWAGACGGTGLESLRHQVEVALERLGFPREERFTSHITLGRRRSSGASPDVQLSVERHRAWVGWSGRVDRFALMASRLEPAGPVYRELGLYRGLAHAGERSSYSQSSGA